MRRALVTLLSVMLAASVWADEPTMPLVYIDTTLGTMCDDASPTTVASGGNLQTAIDGAACGDRIEVEAGATFTGTFTLPDKDCSDSEWVCIVSSEWDGTLPAEGTRVTLSDATSMPKITRSTTGTVLASASDADHYRLIGLDIEATAASVNTLIDLSAGQGSANQTNNIIFDRCIIRGHATTSGTLRGINFNGAYFSVIDSHLEKFKWAGADSQAIAGWNGTGPFKIVNNYIEGAGENVLFGGADSTSEDYIPSDIEVRRNHIRKPTAWFDEHEDYDGSSWTVKNIFELKSARRVWIENNLLENNWVDGQDGTAVLFTVRNQSGTAPWSVVEDVTFRGNWLRHSGSGFNNTGTDDIQESADSSRFAYTNVLITDLSDDWGAAASQRAFTSYSGITDLHLRHVTLIQGSSGTIVTAEGAAATGHIATDSIFSYGGAGYTGTGKSCVNIFDGTYFTSPTISNNVCIGITPGGCINDYEDPGYCTNETAIANVGFVDETTGDYRLDVTSDYYGAGPGGSDLGAWYPTMIAAESQLDWSISWEANGTCVDVTFAVPELAVDTACTVRAGTETTASTTGADSRTEQVCDLTPDQEYAIMVDCGDTIGGAMSYDLYTATADEPDPPGSTAIPFSFGAPAGVLPTAARMTVSWSASQAMTSPTAVQNTDCGSGCTVTILPPEAATSWVQWCWQTAADATLACSKPQQVTVP